MVMAPTETSKVTPKVQRNITRTKPSIQTKKSPTKGKINSARVLEPKQRTKSVSKVSTPKSKENKSVATPGNITKSVKKPSWKRRPKPAHSGVPVPEKMKRLLQQQFQDSD